MYWMLPGSSGFHGREHQLPDFSVGRLLGACERAALYRIHSEYYRFKSCERIYYVEGGAPPLSQVQTAYSTLSKEQLNIDWESPSSERCLAAFFFL